MNRRLKVIFVIVLMIFSIFLINNEVFADKSGSNLVGVFNGKSGEDEVDTKAGEEIITDIIDTILSVVRIVAIGLGIIMITFLGIKYMSAAPTEKANIKNQLITFTIGVVVVVGTTTILGIVKKVATNVTNVPDSETISVPKFTPDGGETTETIKYDYTDIKK